MRLLGQLLLCCLVIAALQGILAVLAVGLVLLLTWGLLFRPAPTIALLALVLVVKSLDLWFWQTAGLLLLIAASLLSVCIKKARAADPTTPRLLLPHHGPDPAARDAD